MKMEDDIFALAQRRRTSRKNSNNPPEPSGRRPSYPSDRILRIDNFTMGPEIPSPAPSPIPQLSPQVQRRFETKPFMSDVAGRDRSLQSQSKNTNNLFSEEVPYSRNIFPPLIPVDINGEEIASLVNTSSHISLISNNLVSSLKLRKEFIPDTSVPPSPLATTGSSNTPYIVEGKLRYVEISIKGSKHVTQLYVARDLPAELVIGVDLLKKAQVNINFKDSSITLPSAVGQPEAKVSFLSSKHLKRSLAVPQTTPGMVPDFSMSRAYSSNF